MLLARVGELRLEADGIAPYAEGRKMRQLFSVEREGGGLREIHRISSLQLRFWNAEGAASFRLKGQSGAREMVPQHIRSWLRIWREPAAKGKDPRVEQGGAGVKGKGRALAAAGPGSSTLETLWILAEGGFASAEKKFGAREIVPLAV